LGDECNLQQSLDLISSRSKRVVSFTVEAKKAISLSIATDRLLAY
jgi:hypothetical protein